MAVLKAGGKGRQRSAGLSIDKFAAAKQTGYDRRQKVASEQEQRTRQKGKYRKLKSKLGKQGWLKPIQVLSRPARNAHWFPP